MGKNKIYLLLIVTTFFWGIQPLCVKIIVAQWTPESLTFFRYIFISAILFAVMYCRGEKNLLPPGALLVPLLLMGFTGIAVNNVLQFTGLKMSTITNVTLIGATGPAITAFLAFVLIRERLSLLQWLGIMISFSGVLLLITKGSWQVLADFSFNLGDIFFLLCQCAWALYSIIGLKVMQRISAIKATAWAGLFGAFEVLLYGSCLDKIHITALNVPSIVSMVFVIIFGGAMAMLFWNMGVQKVGPGLAAIFSNLTPIFGMMVGYIALQEEIGMLQLSGTLIIFTGVFITTQTDLMKRYVLRNPVKIR